MKALIVDDERNAREEVKLLLKSYPDIEIVGEAKNADDAREQIFVKMNSELNFAHSFFRLSVYVIDPKILHLVDYYVQAK